MVTQIWTQTTAGFALIVVKSIEQEKDVKLMKLFVTIEGNYAIGVTISMHRAKLASQHFTTPKSYKFTKENIQGSCHLFAGIAERGTSQKPP